MFPPYINYLLCTIKKYSSVQKIVFWLREFGTLVQTLRFSSKCSVLYDTSRCYSDSVIRAGMWLRFADVSSPRRKGRTSGLDVKIPFLLLLFRTRSHPETESASSPTDFPFCWHERNLLVRWRIWLSAPAQIFSLFFFLFNLASLITSRFVRFLKKNSIAKTHVMDKLEAL